MRKLSIAIFAALFLLLPASSFAASITSSTAGTVSSGNIGGGLGFGVGQGVTYSFSNTPYLITRLFSGTAIGCGSLNLRAYTSLPRSGGGTIVANAVTSTEIVYGSSTYMVLQLTSFSLSASDYYQADIGCTGSAQIYVWSSFPSVSTPVDTTYCFEDNTSDALAVQDCFPLPTPSSTIAEIAPINDTTSTKSISGLVFNEIVALPQFVFKNYETPLVGMAIIIAVVSVLFGLLKWFNIL